MWLRSQKESRGPVSECDPDGIRDAGMGGGWERNESLGRYPPCPCGCPISGGGWCRERGKGRPEEEERDMPPRRPGGGRRLE